MATLICASRVTVLGSIWGPRLGDLKVLKSFLENLNQPLFVRMTGSGSVLVAYYQKKQDCDLAKVQFKRKFKNYWCITSKTI